MNFNSYKMMEICLFILSSKEELNNKIMQKIQKGEDSKQIRDFLNEEKINILDIIWKMFNDPEINENYIKEPNEEKCQTYFEYLEECKKKNIRPISFKDLQVLKNKDNDDDDDDDYSPDPLEGNRG
jgi:delta-aminolevulinic acid dehydratase/porphobilinogen synthase